MTIFSNFWQNRDTLMQNSNNIREIAKIFFLYKTTLGFGWLWECEMKRDYKIYISGKLNAKLKSNGNRTELKKSRWVNPIISFYNSICTSILLVLFFSFCSRDLKFFLWIAFVCGGLVRIALPFSINKRIRTAGRCQGWIGFLFCYEFTFKK